MKHTRLTFAFGITTAIVSAVASPALMIGLSGIGICGSSLEPGTVAISFLMAAGLPALAGTFIRSFWPLGALSFSWALLFYIFVCVSMMQVEWARALVVAGCIAMSFVSAWVGRKLGAEKFVDDNPS